MIDAAILVGGIGSRLGKITKKTPKPLIKIDKKRFLDHLLAKLSRYNFRKIYLLCSYKKKQRTMIIQKREYAHIKQQRMIII